MDLVGLLADLVALEKLLFDVRLAHGREQCRQPVLMADDAVDDGTGLNFLGQRTKAGTRQPPSQLVFFSERKGVMPASGQVL